ncbi:hypothetical protein IIV31_104L [Armadillidium vulgare iridescent virus]|uniref:Uncharacterized protein n=1 Tax=Armadillidium vulgare iridescent virus TaxID=72201 RepID=A0A068QKI2_9VIRU|nr:hypothetical protein IIV31_104L [Armadillidium vulgare iridescent virus]CCV02476.1 hypothetical protein IIV31_104L [Armadillidium vulgare iridescent virus]
MTLNGVGSSNPGLRFLSFSIKVCTKYQANASPISNKFSLEPISVSFMATVPFVFSESGIFSYTSELTNVVSKGITLILFQVAVSGCLILGIVLQIRINLKKGSNSITSFPFWWTSLAYRESSPVRYLTMPAFIVSSGANSSMTAQRTPP